ncbi:MAG: hypothetical protein ATN35_01545 [Epulopiscium sp. Nele67-Bin004]|nr:MAG: hypothetical protein ATN35_01545 [Epulopiscium sp. Nele67-Bin004]
MLTFENKIEIYTRRKNGETISSLAQIFNINQTSLKYLIRLIDAHGLDSVKPALRKRYSIEFKEESINRVIIDGDSIKGVSIEIGLSSPSILRNWVNKFKKNGYTLKKDTMRNTAMKTTNTTIKNHNTDSIEEKLKQLEEENLYLKAQNEYLKKLKALAQNNIK